MVFANIEYLFIFAAVAYTLYSMVYYEADE